ncbi:LysM domain-containing protein [Arthroderma uncinatum]|uniref:LysM domain-containing protein n=1 Tax=Arthroderma uncinatum TaxID=74035 RepID=UPI00144ABCA8|nr:LysM domain-containing protein [Arthroderma uncinatum]KAF3491743.1 LysM domain-containing protein [Arthroderma uncinatum]
MRTALILYSLLCSSAAARSHNRGQRRSGRTDPNAPSDCTLFNDAVTKDHDCRYFEANWGISHQDFVKWNPSVRENCDGIVIGSSYCVEVNYGLPPTGTSITTAVKPATTGSPIPSPNQSGIIDSCTNFYKAGSHDNCEIIVKKFGTFLLEDFYGWNPAVGSSCMGLWTGYHYCVGIPGTPSSRLTTTSAPMATIMTPAGPSPTQDGIVSSCTKYRKAVSDDTCFGVAAAFSTFTVEQFVAWNPAVKSDCSGMWAGYYYCVAIPGTPTAKPTTTTTTFSRAPISAGPWPTQDGIVTNCKAYYKAVLGDSCAVIANRYGTFALEQFIKWNPAVKPDCSAVWIGYYYCIGKLYRIYTSN